MSGHRDLAPSLEGGHDAIFMWPMGRATLKPDPDVDMLDLNRSAGWVAPDPSTLDAAVTWRLSALGAAQHSTITTLLRSYYVTYQLVPRLEGLQQYWHCDE